MKCLLGIGSGETGQESSKVCWDAELFEER
jgi:hypothetical protein